MIQWGGSLSLTFIPNSRLVSVHEPPIIIIIIAIMLPRNVFNVGMRGLGSATDYSNKKIIIIMHVSCSECINAMTQFILFNILNTLIWNLAAIYSSLLSYKTSHIFITATCVHYSMVSVLLIATSCKVSQVYSNVQSLLLARVLCYRPK